MRCLGLGALGFRGVVGFWSWGCWVCWRGGVVRYRELLSGLIVLVRGLLLSGVLPGWVSGVCGWLGGVLRRMV